jgi:hypothetical protein
MYERIATGHSAIITVIAKDSNPKSNMSYSFIFLNQTYPTYLYAYARYIYLEIFRICYNRESKYAASLLTVALGIGKMLDRRWNEVECSKRRLGEHGYESSRRDHSSFSDVPSLGSFTMHSSTQSTLSESFHTSRDLTLPNFFSRQRSIRGENGTISTKSSSNAISVALQSFSTWSRSRQERQQTRIEQDLMRQLEFLQQDKARCIHELQIKLSQRESAIETLETALRIMDSTVQTLRNELDDMKSGQNVTKERVSNNISPSRHMTRGEASMSRSLSKDKTALLGNDRRSSMVVLIPGDDTDRTSPRPRISDNASKRRLTKAKSLSPTRKSSPFTPNRSYGQIRALEVDPLFL